MTLKNGIYNHIDLYEIARLHTAKLYARVTKSVDQLEGCLASGHCIAFGLLLHDRWYDKNGVAKTGIATTPVKGEKARGGHAMLIVGYDRKKRLFLIRNSWGTQWGIQGYCWIPYDYVLHRIYSWDFWMLQTIGGLNGSSRIIIPN